MRLHRGSGPGSLWSERADVACPPTDAPFKMNSLTKDQAGSIFDKVVETCEKKLYDPKLNGVDWRRIAETRRERILAAADEAEFEREFNDLIRELRVSHAGFYHERRPR